MEDPRPGTRPLRDTILGQLSLELAVCASGTVSMRVEVTDDVRDHTGHLSVGACAVLAEGAASTAAGLAAGPEARAFGVELDGSTLERIRDGWVTATATPLHTGRNLHVWEIAIDSDDGIAVYRARCTLAIRQV